MMQPITMHSGTLDRPAAAIEAGIPAGSVRTSRPSVIQIVFCLCAYLLSVGSIYSRAQSANQVRFDSVDQFDIGLSDFDTLDSDISNRAPLNEFVPCFIETRGYTENFGIDYPHDIPRRITEDRSAGKAFSNRCLEKNCFHSKRSERSF